MTSDTTTPVITNANILKAFRDTATGSRVTDPDGFNAVIVDAVASHDPAKDRQSGQHFVVLPESAFSLVSAGVGPRSENPEDYVLRAHRGRVNAYLAREHAAPVESLAIIVYTKQAYLGDPEVKNDDPEEFQRVSVSTATHILVAVLAGAGPKAPKLTPTRLLANLAGGNNEALSWTADEIRQKATEVQEYDNEWVVVAD